jgi:hypothetical protein
LPKKFGGEMAKLLLKCIACGSEMLRPSAEPKEKQDILALTCGNKECTRFGLLSVVAKKENESKIIKPNETKNVQG